MIDAASQAAWKPHRLKGPRLTEASSEPAEKAFAILLRAHETANSLLVAYDLFRKGRGRAGGISSDAEQDVLRATLVMAAAGLDAVAKQLVRDALPTLVRKDSSARSELEKFVARGIRGEGEALDLSGGSRFLARILAAPSTQDAVIADYTRSLTGGSLQSADEVLKVSKALGAATLRVDVQRLQLIFSIRNKVIHELDINLDSTGRKRVHRGLDQMMKHSQYLLQVAEDLVGAVDKSCSAA